MAAKIGNQPSMGVRQVFVFFPTEGATSVSGFDANGATLNYEPFSPPNVYLNGVKLVAGHNYTATTGTSITGIAPMHAGDVVVIEVFGTWSPANAYTKAEANAQFLQKAGGTVSGDVNVSGRFTYGMAKQLPGSTDLDTLTVPGFYDGFALINAPLGNSGWFYIEVQRHSNSDAYAFQRATALNHSNYATWVRNRHTGVWQPWRQVLEV